VFTSRRRSQMAVGLIHSATARPLAPGGHARPDSHQFCKRPPMPRMRDTLARGIIGILLFWHENSRVEEHGETCSRRAPPRSPTSPRPDLPHTPAFPAPLA
jgi:hypothetical protein